jgi:hypothetical protein
MLHILGCYVPQSTLQSWVERLCFAEEPLFLTEQTRHWLPEQLISPRASLEQSTDFRDAYLSYHVPKHAAWVALLTPQTFRELPKTKQLELMRLQLELGRGQMYTLEWVEQTLGHLPAALEPDFFEDRVALRFDVWNALEPELQKLWLRAFVALERQDCLSGTLSSADWQRIEAQFGPSVRRLAGNFSPSSGANCFATVLAALTPDPQESQRLENIWMTHQQLLEGLQARGYRERGALEGVSAQDVMLWHSSEKIIHACLVLGEGLVLNKDAQGWYDPRQIRTLASVLESWALDGEVRVWSQV